MSALSFKVAVAQMRPKPADIAYNLEKMLAYIAQAREGGAQLVVFPELCVSGYMLGDRWEHNAFIKEIEDANDTICAASNGLVVVWGSVKADWNKIGEDGRVRKYNAAFIAQNGTEIPNRQWGSWVPKTNLPKYRIFDDARHFYPAAKLAAEENIKFDKFLQPFIVTLKNKTVSLALTVCEDLWEDEYNAKPSQIYAKQKPDLLIDISQSPWTVEKWRARDRMLTKRAKDAGCPILYVNGVGLQNNGKNLVLFDGSSSLIRKDGVFCWRAPQHGEHLMEISSLSFQLKSPHVNAHKKGIEEIYHAMVPAMQEFFAPFKRVVIGLSGGIDSAVAAAMLVEALGPQKVLAINMPTQFNSKTTQDLAQLCAKNLGITYRVVPIQSLYQEELKLLSRAGYGAPSMLVRENIQARIRGHVLAGIAACEGGVFTNNGNKTEVALNYFTLYGDAAGAVAFLADLWKGQIYELAHFINDNHMWEMGEEIIPKGIIKIVPSAELSDEQNVDEGKGDPIFYEYHDKLLRAFIEQRWDPTTVVTSLLKDTLAEDLGMQREKLNEFFPTKEKLIENLEWAWRQYSIEYKRVQLPPVFLTSRRAFGFDRRDTIADGYFTGEYYRLREMFLKQAA